MRYGIYLRLTTHPLAYNACVMQRSALRLGLLLLPPEERVRA